jgi:hypothetical protein
MATMSGPWASSHASDRPLLVVWGSEAICSMRSSSVSWFVARRPIAVAL